MTSPGWDVTGYYAVQLLPEKAPVDSAGRLAEPGIVEPRPLTVGDVLNGAFRAVRYVPKTMFGLTLAVVLIAQLLAVGAAFLVDGEFNLITSQREFGGATVLMGWSTLTSTIAASLTTIMVEIGLAYAVHEAIIARRTTPSEALRRLGSGAGAALAVAALTGVVVAGAIVGVMVVVGLLTDAVGDGAWLILLILVPGLMAVVIWIGIRLLLAPCVIAVEKAGPIQAIRRSWNLSKGLFWHILGIYLVASLLIWLAATTVGWVFGIASMFVGGSSTELGSPMVGVVSTVVSSVLSLPLTAAVVTLLYVDARIRREGYELQLFEALYG